MAYTIRMLDTIFEKPFLTINVASVLMPAGGAGGMAGNRNLG